MKSYKERLPMIDAAIEHCKWKLDEHPHFIYICFSRAGSGYSLSQEINDRTICTRDEFEHRKAERQNKPSWSDAPEWANWLAQGVSGVWYWWSDKPIEEGSFWMSDVGDNDHPDFKMDRASSEGEVIGNWQDTLEKRPETKEQDMNNDWYEKGELPPVGSVVAFHPCGKHKRTATTSLWIDGDELEVLAHKQGEEEVVAVVWNRRDKTSIGIVLSCLKPLHTETDKMVDAVEQILDGCENVSNRAIAHAIVNAGYRKTKPMSEQEFMKQCLDICGHGDARLYRAGCRFIEQVKV